jgi:hypothetical protein
VLRQQYEELRRATEGLVEKLLFLGNRSRGSADVQSRIPTH